MWGERYGAPPPNTFYEAPGYYYAPRNSYPLHYGNGGNAASQLGRLFVR
jgi:hypothetical protein